MSVEDRAFHDLDHGGRTVPGCDACMTRRDAWRAARDTTAQANNDRANNYTPERADELRARRSKQDAA